MLPIGDDQHKGWHLPIFNIIFIVLNIAIFIYQTTLSDAQLSWFINQYASIPADIMNGHNLYTLFTSTFLHWSWMHLLGNMLFLYVFGDNIESRIGNFKYLLFYVIAGIAASLWHVLTNMGSDIPSLGASGAISGVLGAYLVLFPNSRIKVLNLTYWVGTYLIPAKQFLVYWIVLQLISAGAAWSAVEDASGVAWFAHIGWFVVWVIRWYLLKRKEKYV